jgi:FkbM family methyltransferase
MKIINPFILQLCISFGLKFPDICVNLEEQYGQCGEDIIVVSLIRAYCFKKNIDPAGLTYCEVGGNHPISTSATFLLSKQLGMTGLIVEANPDLIPDLRKGRPHDKIINVAIVASDLEEVEFFIGNRNELSSMDAHFLENWPGEGSGINRKIVSNCIRLDELISKEFRDQCPIFLSIDIEGLDFEVLKSMSFEKIRPYIIQIEPSDHYLPHNSEEILNLLSKKGYELIARTPVNMIFIDLINSHKI